MNPKTLESAAVGALLLVGLVVWGAVAWSCRTKKPPPRWKDVKPPKRPWPKP